MSNRRVVITGMGWVTPLGVAIEETWQALLAGRSGAGDITIFDASQFPVRIAAEVKDWSVATLGGLAAENQSLRDLIPVLSRHARQTQFTVAAAVQAAHAAGLTDTPLDPALLGISLGNGEIMPDFQQLAAAESAGLTSSGWDANGFTRQYLATVPTDTEVALDPSAPIPLIAGLLDAQGPSCNITNACVSSAAAIGRAANVIQAGDADVIIAGGGHSMIHPSGVTGFHRLSTLSLCNDDPAKAAKPFDRERDGFVVGEGAAIVILEELEHAQRRGAEFGVELVGFSANHDAHRVTDPRPDGLGAARCITLALADAQCSPAEIDYINAHGSGTVANDRAETLAIKSSLGTHAEKVPISSTKSMVGHLTTACGALEAIVCALAIRDGVAPPTINYETPDPECDLDFIPNTSRELKCRRVLSNNFGFGGQNVAMIFAAIP